MITRLLVANRAEIASRVFRTCRDLGIQTVAVHSDADAALPYVRQADLAVRLAGWSPAETYLDAGLLVDAARRSGADAVHPGYGFLSESAAFARAVVDAGLTWVGPLPETIEVMGSKVRAKKLVDAVGVPVLEAPEQASADHLPLIVKASAGGGGRGMRVVRDLDRLDDELAAARAEAESAFGDGTVFVEPYVEHARHVEVQVVGDRHGGVVVLGERDCSLQRRHQKVVEETPAPRLPQATRSALHEAARSVAAAVYYVGAGTVEFLYDAAADRFYFLEMNTRLQVEHAVTELVHGVDLVALQLWVAEGARVPVDPGVSGHAVEARLYAEDPAAGHAPTSGVLTTFEIPGAPGLRVDAGYESGSEVSTFYDGMLAKVVAHAPTREQAARTLAGALARARIHGVLTNRDELVAALRDPGFLAGEVTTAFLDTRPAAPAPPRGDHAVAAALALSERDRARRVVQHGIPVAWRNVVSQPQRTSFQPLLTGGSAPGRTPARRPAEAPVGVEWAGGRDGYAVPGLSVLSTCALGAGWRIVLERDGVATAYTVAITDASGAAGADTDVHVDCPAGYVALRLVPTFVDPQAAVPSGGLLAPMPGLVVGVAVEPGQSVEAGQPVLVLEAMKMQHTVTAPAAGVVTRLDVGAGGQVAAGDVLAVVSPAPADPAVPADPAGPAEPQQPHDE
ncbi:MAG TPA: biotin carboxylase N-terminal domain-containing protein [Nocardioides sp.]|uniref:acetyl/propionyl/methylcrotonyl-CoA carboxylase subunit alpha n=1 Tax=Nocardioides sp. TaxID=35761 RepID=UPI002E3390AF|nr:biotin carboxylase N-terminal domain-containing protein [Nocardioides sp.]HEX3930223.1 biotin carboxylase N-terminal domain-containing protein [Nocardioides sp.]